MVNGWPDGLAMLKRFAKAKSLVAENEEYSTNVARAIGLAEKLDFDSFEALKVYYATARILQHSAMPHSL